VSSDPVGDAERFEVERDEFCRERDAEEEMAEVSPPAGYEERIYRSCRDPQCVDPDHLVNVAVPPAVIGSLRQRLDAFDEIAAVLSGHEWDADTTQVIVQIMRNAGAKIDEPQETP
jgi:hypothetical protein